MHAWGFGLIYKRTCPLILCTLRVLYSLSLSLPAYFIESHTFYHKNMKSDIPTQSSTHKKIQKQLFSFHVLRKVSTFSRPGWHSWMVGSAMQSMYLILLVSSIGSALGHYQVLSAVIGLKCIALQSKQKIAARSILGHFSGTKQNFF